MAKAELGEKQICPSCGAKFYDLRRRPAACPKCAHTFDPADETVKLKRAKTTTKAPVYETESDDEEEGKLKRRVSAEEDDEVEEDEAEETKELDVAAVEDAPDLGTEDEEEVTPGGDALPPGFSEAGEDDLEVAATEDDEEGVPLLEDDEAFSEDELGEVGEGEDEEEPR